MAVRTGRRGVRAGRLRHPWKPVRQSADAPVLRRHRIRLYASYNTHGFNLGGSLNYASGSPLNKNFYEYTDGSFSNYRSPLGTEPGTNPNNPRNFSEFRLPDSMSVDLRVSYDFYAVIKQHLTLIGDFFNLFNLRQPNGIGNTDDANFGLVTSRQGPFTFQLAARYQY